MVLLIKYNKRLKVNFSYDKSNKKKDSKMPLLLGKKNSQKDQNSNRRPQEKNDKKWNVVQRKSERGNLLLAGKDEPLTKYSIVQLHDIGDHKRSDDVCHSIVADG